MKNYKFKIHGTSYAVDIKNVEDNIIELEVNGTPYKVEVDKELKPTKATPKIVRASQTPAQQSTPMTARPAASSAAAAIKSPLPGTILDVFVNVGDTVKAGQKIMLLEAMKMENQIDADRDGVVKEIKARKGDAVMEGDVLITIG